MKLYFIINGIQTEVLAENEDLLKDVSQKALNQTDKEIRPKYDLQFWQVIHFEKGITLDYKLTISEQPISENDIIVLSLKAGTGA